MGRLFKEDEYNLKRNEILDFAVGLMGSKGYERMTIQDILDGLHISKGALYHYFESKKAILEATIDRIGQEAEQAILPVVQSPDLSSVDKFRRYFEISAQWKNARRDLLTKLLPMWFSDQNVFLRQKMTAEALVHTSRLLEPIIRQGVDEGVFSVRSPRRVAFILTGVFLNLADALVLPSAEAEKATFQEFRSTMGTYTETIERILGAPDGSLDLIAMKDLKGWFAALHPEKPEGKRKN